MSTVRHAHQRVAGSRSDRATDSSPAARSLRAFLITGTTFFVLLAGVNLATPLYAVYQTRFHFSSAVLTLVFATYAIVLAPSLLVFGQLSDRFGRRVAGVATSVIGV